MIDLDPATGQSGTDTQSSAKHTTIVETVFIVVISIAMVLIPVAEVLLRKIRGQGPGLGPIVQHLSVWLGFIGALGATAAGKHLGLATTAFLRDDNPLKRIAGYLSGAVSSVTAMMLAWASYIALKDNAVSTDKLPAGIPE